MSTLTVEESFARLQNELQGYADKGSEEAKTALVTGDFLIEAGYSLEQVFWTMLYLVGQANVFRKFDDPAFRAERATNSYSSPFWDGERRSSRSVE